MYPSFSYDFFASGSSIMRTIDCAFLGTFEKFIGMDMSLPPLYLHPYFFGIFSPSLNAGELISIAKALMGNKDIKINDKNFNIMKIFFIIFARI